MNQIVISLLIVSLIGGFLLDWDFDENGKSKTMQKTENVCSGKSKVHQFDVYRSNSSLLRMAS